MNDAYFASEVQDFNFTYIYIADSTGKYLLGNDADGAIRLAPMEPDTTNGGLIYKAFNSIVVSDYSDRIIHYYSNEMSQFGVSRFRLSAADQVPNMSILATLVPLNVSTLVGMDDMSPVYVVVDTAQNVFYPIVCSYTDDQPSKVFLAKDPTAGAQRLAQADLIYTMTGGVVSQCIFYPFVADTDGFPTASS